MGALAPPDDRQGDLHGEIDVEPAGDAIEEAEVVAEAAALAGGPGRRRLSGGGRSRGALADRRDQVVDRDPHLRHHQLGDDQGAAAGPQPLGQLDAVDLEADAVGGDGGAGQPRRAGADQDLAVAPVGPRPLEGGARHPHQPAGQRGLQIAQVEPIGAGVADALGRELERRGAGVHVEDQPVGAAELDGDRAGIGASERSPPAERRQVTAARGGPRDVEVERQPGQARRARGGQPTAARQRPVDLVDHRRRRPHPARPHLAAGRPGGDPLDSGAGAAQIGQADRAAAAVRVRHLDLDPRGVRLLQLDAHGLDPPPPSRPRSGLSRP